MTTWREVEGAPGYEVSDDGRVRVSKELHQTLNNGYKRVQVTVKGQYSKQRNVHRLVAEAFLGPQPSPEHVVCHNDGNSANNHVENLRWDTQKGNAADRVKHGTGNRGSRCGMAKLKEAHVVHIWARLRRGETCRSIAKAMNVSISSVEHIRKRERWQWFTENIVVWP